MLETGAGGFDVSRRLGTESLGRAKSVTSRFSSGLAGRANRWRAGDEAPVDVAE